MTTQNRRDVLAGLKTVLQEITTIKTVVRTYMSIDLLNYSQADLPLVEINEPEETPDPEMTSQREMMDMNLALKCWFLNWGENPTATYESLVKAIRDKIGSNFTLSCAAIECQVGSVSGLEGEMPLFSFKITLRIKYYLDMLSA
jgi:hypothetical protein